MQARIADLGDLDLAILVSLVAEQHCIFSAAVDQIQALQEELRLSCIETFGIQPAIISCSSKTTVDEFNESLLVSVEDDHFSDAEADRHDTLNLPTFEVDYSPSRDRSPGRFGSIGNTLDDRRIADVVIATGLDTSDESVQVQAFELINSRRIFTRSAMHVAPKDMLFIAVVSKPNARLFRHLNDTFCMSHFHNAEDGLPHTEYPREKPQPPDFDAEDIKHLRDLAKNAQMTAEIAQYLHNVLLFMRNSRYVKGGVTAAATRQLRVLSAALAPLQGIDYIPPSLVAIAARKIYAHRLVLATSQNERSLQWGSDPEAIKQLLKGVTVDNVIEDVIASVETPL